MAIGQFKNERETFLESHKQLTEMVRWINMPMFTVSPAPGQSKDEALEEMRHIDPGTIVIVKPGQELGTWNPIPAHRIDLILQTFCESHNKLRDIA